MREAVTHEAPLGTGGLMPCCGRTPFEAMRDRMTDDPALVTCREAERSAGAAPLDVAKEALERIRQKMSDWQDACQEAGVYRDGAPDQQMAKWVHDEAAAALRLSEGTDR